MKIRKSTEKNLISKRFFFGWNNSRMNYSRSLDCFSIHDSLILISLWFLLETQYEYTKKKHKTLSRTKRTLALLLILVQFSYFSWQTERKFQTKPNTQNLLKNIIHASAWFTLFFPSPLFLWMNDRALSSLFISNLWKYTQCLLFENHFTTSQFVKLCLSLSLSLFHLKNFQSELQVQLCFREQRRLHWW